VHIPPLLEPLQQKNNPRCNKEEHEKSTIYIDLSFTGK